MSYPKRNKKFRLEGSCLSPCNLVTVVCGSELCLGTMNFEKGRGHQGDWTLTEEEATPIFKTAIDKGLFYFDCAMFRPWCFGRGSWFHPQKDVAER